MAKVGRRGAQKVAIQWMQNFSDRHNFKEPHSETTLARQRIRQNGGLAGYPDS